MIDFGLGMLDKRSVIAILFGFGLAATLRLNIPFDTTNALTLFLGLVILTGGLYFCRSILRLIIIGFASLNKSVRETAVGGIRFWPRTINDSPVFVRISWLLFDDSAFRQITINMVNAIPELTDRHRGDLFIILVIQPVARFLDRVGLITLVFASCIPQFKQYVMILGMVGVGLLLLIFIFRGSFSFLIKDSSDTMKDVDIPE